MLVWHLHHRNCWAFETYRLLLCDVMYYYTITDASKRDRPPALEGTRLQYYSYYYSLTAVELSLGGSRPYTGTDKTNRNKYT